MKTTPHSESPSVFRMTRERFADERAVLHTPSSLGGLSDWQELNASLPRARSVFFRNVSLNAKDYNVARFSARADSGKTATLTWTSDLEPRFENNPGTSVAILADNLVHTYSFALDPRSCETWAGHITGLYLTLSDEPAQVSMESFACSFEPPDGPMRITIDNETREATAGEDMVWRVTIPPNAVFEAFVGMRERAWKACATDGVTFKAILEAPNITPRVLLDATLNPLSAPQDRQWRRFRSGLSNIQGVQATIRFSIDHGRTRDGDYAYWGNPVVFTADKSRQDTPVVLISCDTLRADHLSCYGYPRPTSPHLDQWARETVLFENAICQEAWTLTSHMTMHTGLYPKNHRVTPMANLAESVPTLADVLSARGYRTAGFTGFRNWLAPESGFAQGFDIYSTPDVFRTASDTMAKVQAWLRGESSSVPFLFLHNADIHMKGTERGHRPYDPYNAAFNVFSNAFLREPTAASLPPTGDLRVSPWDSVDLLESLSKGTAVLDEPTRQYLVACYDDCVLYVDSILADLFGTLKLLGLYDRALIIVTADHGEEFGEHGHYQHVQAYQECAHVPMMIKFPFGQFAGRRVRDIVQLTDLFPTIMDVLGVSGQPNTDGQDLVPVIEGITKAYGRAFTQRCQVQSCYDNNYALVHNRVENTLELFDLATDYGGKTDVSSTAPDIRAKMEPILASFFTPNEEGWCFFLRGTGNAWQGDLRLATACQFLSADLVYRQHEQIAVQGSSIRADIIVSPAFPHEEFIVTTTSPDAPLDVLLTSDAPFEVLTPGGTWEQTTRYQTVLDPATVPDIEPSFEAGSPEMPRFYVRHRAARAEQTPAKPSTPEERKQLEALGYF